MINRRTILTSTAAMAAIGLSARHSIAQTTPALPPVPKPADWAKANAIAHVNLSPDGKHICYVTEKDAIKYLYVFDLTKKDVKSFNMGNSDISHISWVDNSHVLLTAVMPARFTTGARKGQNLAATIFNLDAGTQNILFSNMPEYYTFVAGTPRRFKYQGKWQIAAISYKTGIDDDNSYLYRFDLDGTNSWPMDRSQNAIDYMLSPDGEMISRTCYDYRHHKWTLDYRTGDVWKQIFSFTVSRLFPSIEGLAADGKSLIIYMPNDSGTRDICEISPEGTVSAPLIDRELSAAATFDQTTFRHNGFVTYGDWITYQYRDPAYASVASKAQTAVDGYRMQIIDFADDPNKIVIYTEGDDDAGTYYYIDFSTGKPLEIGRCYPDIPTDWISATRAISYKASDGLIIPAFLTLPAQKAPKGLPLVVYPHDGPRGSDDLGVDWIVQALADLGYAVLQPQYRGSTRHGTAYIAAGNGHWGGKILTDLSDGVAYLAAQGTIDAKRVTLFGNGGYNGYLALAGVALQSGIYNSAVEYAGISDVKLYRQTEIGDDTSPGYHYFRTIVGETTDLDTISPAQFASRITVPVMIIHNEEATDVDIQQSRKMVAAMKAAGKSVEFVDFKAETSWGLVERSRIDFIDHVSDFLSRHNPT